jgi:sulfur carrier protein ThiS adenylyltransferase
LSPGEGYFSRQLVLDGFGRKALRALARSRVLVAGLGGTGSVASVNLALAGVGSISLIDRDEVSMENLHRQPIYATEDVGKSKAEVAAGFLEARVPGLRVEYRAENLDSGSAPRLTKGVDLVVDCLDNMPSRRALNIACVNYGTPLVHTGSLGWDGSVAVFAPPETACLECLFPREVDEPLPSCEEVGALGAVTSVVGAMGALEAIKLLATGDSSLKGKLLFYDGRRALSRVVTVKRRKTCPSCGAGGGREESGSIVELCGDGEFYMSRAFPPLSFALIPEMLGPDARKVGESVISATRDGVKLSFFRYGGLLIRGASSEEEARRIVDSLRLARDVRHTSQRKS